MVKLNGSLRIYDNLEQRSGQIFDEDIYRGGSKLFFHIYSNNSTPFLA